MRPALSFLALTCARVSALSGHRRFLVRPQLLTRL
jgi:hypothetical protein